MITEACQTSDCFFTHLCNWDIYQLRYFELWIIFNQFLENSPAKMIHNMHKYACSEDIILWTAGPCLERNTISVYNQCILDLHFESTVIECH